MTRAIVDIAVACSAHQTPDWWSPIMAIMLETDRSDTVQIGSVRTVSSALPDTNKNSTIGQQKRRWSLTDANRNEITNKGFLNGNADWIFWIDDDTVPPQNAILSLIKLGLPFVAGLYFLPRKPFNPIAYKRHIKSGLYAPVYKYPRGGLFEVDSVGMGCTLIHRSVYEKIKEEHMVFERYNGAIFPVHKSLVKKPIIFEHKERRKPYVKYGQYREDVIPMREEDDRNFPFYLLEHGRTEDHHFCELAENVGIKPHIDTTITCEHYKHQATTVEDYENEIEKSEELLQ
jgi:hypothetical protein